MDSYDITASALTAQRLRLDIISSNLANANTTRKADGSVGAYRRKNVVFAPIYDQAGKQFGGASGAAFAESIPLKPSPSGFSMGPNGPMLRAGVSENQFNGAGVQVVTIAEDNETPTRMVYDPSHPDANEKGYVELPNINMVTEMVDMISASRAYEANVTAFKSSKSMAQAALEI
jgi:flagellar basal-body rod protein FlgC